MAAMLKLCLKEIQDMVELRWYEVGETYETLKDRVVGWATTKTEKRGGRMSTAGEEVGEEEEGGEWWDEGGGVGARMK